MVNEYVIIEKCSCGYTPHRNSTNNLDHCSENKALCNHVTFPSLKIFPNSNENSIYYNNDEFKYKKNWAALFEINKLERYNYYYMLFVN